MENSAHHETLNRLEDTLEKYIPNDELKKVKQLLYGEETKYDYFMLSNYQLNLDLL